MVYYHLPWSIKYSFYTVPTNSARMLAMIDMKGNGFLREIKLTSLYDLVVCDTLNLY